eukprot:s1234_g6.t1
MATFRGPVTSCCCCYTDFAPDSPVALLQCGHMFCQDCIDSWQNEDLGVLVLYRPRHLEELRLSFDARLRELLAENVEVDLGVNWACPSAEPFLRVLQDERLLDFLVELCGLPLDTYTTHVGFSWSSAEAEAAAKPHPVTLWVALDTASSESGGMEMVPGRHRELLGAAVPKGAIVDAAAHGASARPCYHGAPVR